MLLQELKPTTKLEDTAFTFDLERMKQHLDGETVMIPKGLTYDELMDWLLDENK